MCLDEDQAEFPDLQCIIRIIPIVLDDVFATSRLLPNKNCLRLQPTTSNGADQALVPTPFYNASLRSDCVVNSYLKLLHGASVKCEAFKDACILGRLWLRQRGFGGSIEKGGFGHFEWAILMALLLQGGGPKGHNVLSPGYNSHQLFKAILQFLSSRDLITNALVVPSGVVDIPKEHGPVVFDGDRNHNLLFKMMQWSYKLVRSDFLRRISWKLIFPVTS